MGRYLNPRAEAMRRSRRSSIYVDKSELISHTNRMLGTQDCYICVSRPRRFGKTMTAQMLSSYYSQGDNAHDLFDDLSISKDPSYKKHLNKHSLFFVSITEFVQRHDREGKSFIIQLQEALCDELHELFPLVNYKHRYDLMRSLNDVYESTGEQFIFIIDEWDCVCRERANDSKLLQDYLYWLRDLFKDQDYIALVYMTGILPIHKYGTQSALNMFIEYTMICSDELAGSLGFTSREVESLCQEHSISLAEMQRWYDGYILGGDLHIYNPRSVVRSINSKHFRSYWTTTESFESLRAWIAADHHGLQQSIIAMLGGEHQKVNTRSFDNSFADTNSRDKILSLLIHLGYLGYDEQRSEVFIPNQEIAGEFVATVQANNWKEVIASLQNSEHILESIWKGDSQELGRCLDNTYFEGSLLAYNDENSIACRLSLALYTARQYYTIVREMPGGRGFADQVFIPRPNHLDKPAIIAELKWDINVEAAISQIKQKRYPDSLQAYKGNMVLVGISYDKRTKKHRCLIETYTKFY